METTVYADVLFFVNFSMDFITLWISAIISSRPRKALRMSLAAAFGGLYGVLSVIFRLGGGITYLLAGAVSIIMCLIAFGAESLLSLIKQSALVWGCGALLGGVMTALLSIGTSYGNGISPPGGSLLGLIAAISVVAVYITVRMICNTKNKRSATVRAKWKDREISFSALCDSGNLLRDPLSGDPVIPVSREIVSRLCGKDTCDSILCLDADKLSELGISVRLIPHRSDGQSTVIGGFLPDLITVECDKKKRQVRCVIAPRPCPKNYYAGHGATISPSLLP
ncbi:MAG: hypothetical protein E7647_08545 [Ruminococcaceae bacterium]|nr:hypothetical protein [Oscillospiraceae bacterium]